MANPKLRLPGQRGRRRRSGDREEGFPSLVRPGLLWGRGKRRGGWILTRGRYDTRGWRYRQAVVGLGAGIERARPTTDRRSSTTDGGGPR